MWFGMTGTFTPASEQVKAAADAACREFAPCIRGTEELKGGEWDTGHGLYAKMLLCDQVRDREDGMMGSFSSSHSNIPPLPPPH